MRRSFIPRPNAVFRAMTLACFFCFSCLNNGFTYFIVSQGKTVQLDITPKLVRSCINTVNPIVWTKYIKTTLIHHVYFKSTRAVGIASQRAVQQMLVESNLFQIWRKASLGTESPSLKTQSLISYSNSDSKSPVLSAQNLKHPGRTFSHILDSVASPLRLMVLKNSSGYIKVFMENSLFTGGKPIMMAHSFGYSGFTSTATPALILAAFAYILSRKKFRRWLTSSMSRGGTDNPENFFSSVAKFTITLSGRQGDFLLWGNR